jgi:hypothetical protein
VSIVFLGSMGPPAPARNAPPGASPKMDRPEPRAGGMV